MALWFHESGQPDDLCGDRPLRSVVRQLLLPQKPAVHGRLRKNLRLSRRFSFLLYDTDGGLEGHLTVGNGHDHCAAGNSGDLTLFIDSDNAFLAYGEGQIFCLNPQTGRLIGQVQLNCVTNRNGIIRAEAVVGAQLVIADHHIGAYDLMAIEWGYRWYPEGTDENQVLNELLAKYKGKEYRYSETQSQRSAVDPRALSDDLGDGDTLWVFAKN